jgi:tetratricopeptide (TPR) repeat protein
MGPGAADLAQLVPLIRNALPDLELAPEPRSPEDRFRMFDSLAQFLASLSRDTPVLLLLDDLHWADRSSLRALAFVAQAIYDQRVLAVCVWRDREVDSGHPLWEVIEVLAQRYGGAPIQLEGLASAEIADYVEFLSAQTPPPALAETLWKRTRGNPLFIKALVELLLDRDQLDASEVWGTAIPRGLRDVIESRLARLTSMCQDALRTGAVIGHRFDAGLLERVGDQEKRPLENALAEAVAADLLREQPDGYAFSHPLLQEVLRGSLTAAQRAPLHGAIVDALEATHSGDLDVAVSALAEHSLAVARAGGDAARAVRYTARAAELATMEFAFDEAVLHAESSLQAMERIPDASALDRCVRLLEIGRTLNRAAEQERASRYLEEAAGLAEKLQRGDLVAQAALECGWPVHPFLEQTYNETRLRLIDVALGLLPSAASPLRARLLAGLSYSLYTWGDAGRCISAAEEAVVAAKHSGDLGAIGFALGSKYVALMRPDFVGSRLELAREVVESLDESSTDPNEETWYRSYCLIELFRNGDSTGALAEALTMERVAARSRQRLTIAFASKFRAMTLLSAGRFEAAEEMGAQVNPPEIEGDMDALMTSLAHRFYLSQERGGLAVLEPEIRNLAFIDAPIVRSWRCTLALMLSFLGRDDEARNELDAIAADDFAALGNDFTWSGSIAEIAWLCTRLGLREHAATLYTKMAPHAEFNVLLGNILFYGPFSRYLGLLAATLERFDAAERHFSQSVDTMQRMNAPAWLARCQFDWVCMLQTRGASGDADHAGRLLEETLATSRQLGMTTLTAEAERAGAG